MEKGNGGSPVSEESVQKKESMKYRDNKEDSDSIDSATSHESDLHPESETLSVSLAQPETGESIIDAVIAQERALLVFEKLQKALKDLKLLLTSSNFDFLSDKGEKVRRIIAEQEKELEDVMTELKNWPLVQLTSESQGSTEPDAKRMGKMSISEKEREINDRLEDLNDSLMTRPTEDKKSHQQHVLAWLLWREKEQPAGGILPDDMGPGKTLIMISLIIASNARDSEGHRGGTLVVCRNVSQLEQWEKEIQNRCSNTLKVMVYHDKPREIKADALSSKHVVITTYGILAREYKSGIPYSIHWERVVLDEAHEIYNFKNKSSKGVCAISARKRWALTPDQIKTKDLYSIMKFLKYKPFDDREEWNRLVEQNDSVNSQRLSDITRRLKYHGGTLK